jgi:hypothetical protein
MRQPCHVTQRKVAVFTADCKGIAKSIVRLWNTKLEDELIRKGGVMLRFWHPMSRGHVH